MNNAPSSSPALAKRAARSFPVILKPLNNRCGLTKRPERPFRFIGDKNLRSLTACVTAYVQESKLRSSKTAKVSPTGFAYKSEADAQNPHHLFIIHKALKVNHLSLININTIKN